MKPRQSRDGWQTLVLAGTWTCLGAGGLLYLLRLSAPARWTWAAATAIALIPTFVASIRSLLHRQLGVDLIAVLAMAGALTLGEYLAGAIIAVMLTRGTALERFAVARARRELTALLKRAPRVAHRRAGENVTAVGVEVNSCLLAV
ncbi:MAG: hypothetical protein ACYDCL_12470 [Myxococcales bacterium]